MLKLLKKEEHYKTLSINNYNYTLKTNHYNELVDNINDWSNIHHLYNISINELIELIKCDFTFVKVSKDKIMLTSIKYDTGPFYDVKIYEDSIKYYKYYPFSIVNTDINYQYYDISLDEFQSMLDMYYPDNEYKKMLL